MASYEKLNQSIPVYTIVAEVLRILIKRRFCDFEFEHCANKNSARYLILQFLDRLTFVTSVRQDWIGLSVPKLVASLDRSSLYAIGGEALVRIGRTKYKKINMGILECLCKGQHFSRYDCEWFILAQRLNHHRMNSIAIMIPDSLANILCKQK